MWEPVAVAILAPLVWMALDLAVPGLVATRVEAWLGEPIYLDPSTALLAVVVGFLAAIGPVWKISRYLGTYAHEIGHATVGALIGANLDDVRIHADSSGLAVYRIPASWGRLRHCMVAAAGYPAPGVVGCATTAAVAAGYSRAWLAYMTVVIAIVVLLQVRNLWGVFSGIGIVAAGYALTRQPLLDLVPAVTLALGVTLHVAGIRQARILGKSLAYIGDSDAHQLSHWGWLPARFWSLLFLLTALATSWFSWNRISPILGVEAVPSLADLEGIVNDLLRWFDERIGSLTA